MPTLPAATAQAATVVVVTGDILVTVFPVPMITNALMAHTIVAVAMRVPIPRAVSAVPISMNATARTVAPVMPVVAIMTVVTRAVATLVIPVTATAAPMITNVPMALTAATATPPVPTPRAATTVTATPVTLAAATVVRTLTSVL